MIEAHCEKNKELYKKYNNRKSDAMINAVAIQLETMQIVINEIRNEQKKIVTDLLQNTLHTESVSQRQKEYTIPMLDGIRKEVFGGNGGGGLLEEHIKCQERVIRMEKSMEETKQLRIWVRNLTVTIVISVLSIVGTTLMAWSRLTRTVEINTARIDTIENLHPRLK